MLRRLMRLQVQPQRQMQRLSLRCAFTLIELTVALATFAIAATVTLAAIGDIRRDARELKCIHNLGQLANAAAIFSNTHTEEHLTPYHPNVGIFDGALGEMEWGGRSGKGDILAGNATDIENSIWSTRFGRGPATREFNKVLYRRNFPDFLQDPGPANQNWINDTNLDLDVYRCPADVGATGTHYSGFRNARLSSYDHYGNSYTTATLWTFPNSPPQDCKIRSASAFLHGVTDVPSPGRTILFMENCGKFAWVPGSFGQCISGSPGDVNVDNNIYPGGWHGRRSVYGTAFVDGHAASTVVRGAENPRPDIGIYPPCPQSADCSQVYGCTPIRGPEWQLDVLPTPLRDSVLNCNNPRGAFIIGVGF